MIRYVARPKSDDDWWDEEHTRGHTVYENTDGVATGLLDQFGNELMRVNDIGPVGFRLVK